MKLFFSNMGSVANLEQYIHTPIDYLVSYYGLKALKPPIWAGDIFLDSGAFSAFKKKQTLDIKEYGEFIKIYQNQLFVYANMDVIGNAQQSWNNQMALEKLGLNPIPCFHLPRNKQSADWKWLRRYAQRYDYIALGGMVPLSARPSQLFQFLENCWELFDKYNPTIKIHGFGVQNENLLRAFPWYSVDASSVHVIARYGGIYTPWGAFKINPNVNKREIKWKNAPNKLGLVQNWVKTLEFPFSFEEAEAHSPAGVQKRCCISIRYFTDIKEDIEQQHNTKRPRTGSFGLVVA